LFCLHYSLGFIIYYIAVLVFWAVKAPLGLAHLDVARQYLGGRCISGGVLEGLQSHWYFRGVVGIFSHLPSHTA